MTAKCLSIALLAAAGAIGAVGGTVVEFCGETNPLPASVCGSARRFPAVGFGMFGHQFPMLGSHGAEMDAVLRAAAPAGSVTLAWTDPTTNTDGSSLTDLAGCKIYQGFTSQAYSVCIDVGNVTQTVFAVQGGGAAWLSTNTTVTASRLTFTLAWSPPVVSNGLAYYFAATCYNTASNESDFSSELVYQASAPILSGYQLLWGTSPNPATVIACPGAMYTGTDAAFPRAILYFREVALFADGTVLTNPAPAMAVNNRKPGPPHW